MSDYTPQPGRGTLFKQDADRPAAWSGKVTLPDGAVAYLDLYKATERDSDVLKQDKNGNPYYQVRIKAIDGARSAPQSQRPVEDFRSDTLDDDLPF